MRREAPARGYRHRTSNVLVGTSGWVYRDWDGTVYPDALPDRDRLSFLSRRLPTIEINATFYRLPPRSTFERWAAQVPDGFVFATKMSRYLTHIRRLRSPEEPISRFWERALGLGPSLGPVLFQTPPTLRRDVGLLEGVLARRPSAMRAAFEFRHPSWDDDEVRTILDEAGAAWVIADRPGIRYRPIVTGGWSYVRLHRAAEDRWEYGSGRLRTWASRLSGLPAEDVFVYCNNDPGGAAARDAERLTRYLARGTATLAGIERMF